MYLNRLYADPVKPTKFANLVRRGLSKTPSCCRWHLNQDGPGQEEAGDGDGDGGAAAGHREEGRGMQLAT